MNDTVRFAVLMPAGLLGEIEAVVAASGSSGKIEIVTMPAEASETAMGFDPVATPLLIWTVVKFVGAGVAGGILGEVGKLAFDTVRGASASKDVFELTVRLPDGSRFDLKGTDEAALANFGKLVLERQAR